MKKLVFLIFSLIMVNSAAYAGGDCREAFLDGDALALLLCDE